MKEWFAQNISWLLVLVFVPITLSLIKLFNKRKKDVQIKLPVSRIENNPNNVNNNNLTINNLIPTSEGTLLSEHEKEICESKKLDNFKLTKHILFIDDDTKFKVVSILKKSGWIHTKSVKDIDSYDSKDVLETDIFFVDIQGVGKQLECKDEGLGLAMNLKNKYPLKKVVIYSAETKGERFHDALRIADSFLSKNAEPYQFQQLHNVVLTFNVKCPFGCNGG